MSKFLLLNGYASGRLADRGLNIKDLIEYMYMSYQHAMHTDHIEDRQIGIYNHNLVSDIIGTYTLLNCLQICGNCPNSCPCPLFSRVKGDLDNLLERLLSRKHLFEAQCIQKSFPRVCEPFKPIKDIDEYREQTYTILGLTKPYILSNHGMTFEMVCEYKWATYMFAMSSDAANNEDTIKAKKLLQAFANIEVAALLCMSLESIHSQWYLTEPSPIDIVLTHLRLVTSVHELNRIGNDIIAIFKLEN